MARIWKWSVVVFLIIGLCCHQEEAMMNALMDTPYMVWGFIFQCYFICLFMGWFFKCYSKNRVL